MSSIKDGSYINIQSFMVTELELKGNELLVYAIIYGFSQAEGTYFNGSIQYLADWTNSTRQGIIKNLKSLIEKGLIEKIGENNQINYYKANRVVNKVYQSTEFTSKHSLQGESTEFTGTSKQSLHNNIIYNIDNNIIEREEGVAPVEKLKETENIGMYYQEVKLLLSDYKINFKSIARLGKPIQRIKDIIKFAKDNNKGEGWIVGAIKDNYKLETYQKKETPKRENIGKKHYEVNEDNEKLYEMLGIK